MARASAADTVLLTLLSVVLPAPVVWAQGAGSITGTVKDTSGAVLPGVTIEVTSPVLIEKARSAETDSQGLYRVVELRPGTYTVTFTLLGFSTIRREGIELTGGFTATVNAELSVGALQETVTVTGESPLVDVQSARRQVVVSDELLSALPSSMGAITNLQAVTPGLIANSNIGGASGTYSTNSAINMRIHGEPAGGKINFDGLRKGHLESTGAAGTITDPSTVQEYSVDAGAGSAESSAMGISINMIPREGSNSFTWILSGTYTTNGFQSDNLTDELRARGLTSVNQILYLFNSSIAAGGAIKRDKLWWFAAAREAGNKNSIAGVYFNSTQGTPFYTPDLSRPAFRRELLNDETVRFTWQASPRNKFNFHFNIQHNTLYRGRGENLAPEAAYQWRFWPQGFPQVTWSAPLSGRLLLEAGAAAEIFHWPQYLQSEVRSTPWPAEGPNDVAITDQLSGFLYNANTALGAPRVADRYSQRFAVSYVTGAHALKLGFQIEEGIRTNHASANGDMRFRFQGSSPGAAVPNQVTLVAPFTANERMLPDLGIYFQDRWTFRRMTLTAGLRFDYLRSYVPAQHQEANRYFGARDFDSVDCVPCWTDLDPRVGVSYDLFGNGRTALKMSAGRFLSLQSVQLANANNPVVTSVNTVNRVWNDRFYPEGDVRRGNYVPDCNLLDPADNAECGALDNQNFGRNNPSATRYDPDYLRGFGKREYLWDITAEVQQQLGRGISLTAGYYRNWSGNFIVTRNLAVTPEDFSPYSIVAPLDARLPDGGGYPVTGLYDISRSKFGQVQNLVTYASNFGQQERVADFFNVSVNTRLGSGIQLGGGVDTGRTVNDTCFVVNSPQDLLNCHIVTPFWPQTQFKAFGSLPLPGDFYVSGTFQNTSAGPLQNVVGPGIDALYAASNAEIVPTLGRNLGACAPTGVCNATATVPLIAPQTMFDGRKNQIDLRLTKVVKLGSKLRLRANADLYNALNASGTYVLNTSYSRTNNRWLQPISDPNVGGAIMDGRFFQLSATLSY